MAKKKMKIKTHQVNTSSLLSKLYIFVVSDMGQRNNTRHVLALELIDSSLHSLDGVAELGTGSRTAAGTYKYVLQY